MCVYLDLVFALNGSVNYLLLRASGRLLGSTVGRKRVLLGAMLGAAYGALSFVPGLEFLSGLLWRIAALLAMLLLAFGTGHRTLPLGAIFLALSFALGGLVMVLSSMLGAQVWILDGRAFYSLDFGAIVLTAGALYLGLWLLLQGSLSHSGGGIVSARLTLGGREETLSLLRDSGNTLRDPFTGCAVPIVEARVMERLLPQTRQCRGLWEQDAVGAMSRLHEKVPELSMRLIPFRAVGTEHSMLLALRCDKLQYDGKTQRDLFVAVSPTRVSEHGTYQGLIGERGTI